MRSRLSLLLALLVAGTALAQPTPTPAGTRSAGGRAGGQGSASGQEQAKGSEQPAPQGETTARQAVRYAVGWNAEKARETLERVTGEAAASVDYRVAKALVPMAEGKLDPALAELDQAAKSSPAAPGPEYYRGELLLWKGNAKGAEDAWKAAAAKAQAELTRTPKDGWASYYLGAARVRLRQYGPAREALAAALANGASEPLVRYQLGLVALAEQRWQEAVDAFTAALAKDPGFAYAYYYRGLAWSKLKRTDQLLLDMDRFLALAPESPDAPKARSVLEASKR